MQRMINEGETAQDSTPAFTYVVAKTVHRWDTMSVRVGKI
jgi:hypothetical protein